MKTYKIKLLCTFASKRSKRWASEIKIGFVVEDGSAANQLPTVQYPNAVKMVHKIDFRTHIGKKYTQIMLKFTYRILIEVLGNSNGPYQQSEKKKLSHYFSSLISAIVGYLELDYSIYAEKKFYM